MGKNHIENSLKHFLKRKVKITLGFVVAFMISGTVGFAESTIVGEENHIENEWLIGIGNNETLLDKNIIWNGKTVLETNEINNNSKLFSDKIRKNILNAIVLGNQSIEQEYNHSLINDEIYKQGLSIKKTSDSQQAHSKNSCAVLEKGEHKNLVRTYKYQGTDWYAVQSAKEGGIAVNRGIIIVERPTELEKNVLIGQYTKNGKLYNYGIINSGSFISQKLEGGEAYNFGILISEGNAQYGSKDIDDKLFNYGIILGNQNSENKGEAYNYGIIKGIQSGETAINKGFILGKQNGENNINYGVIEGEDGQLGKININYGFTKDQYSIEKGENYGFITEEQRASEESSSIYNYNYTAKQDVISSSNGKVYNYGVTNEMADNKKTNYLENNGIIINIGDKNNYFHGNIESKNHGIILTRDGDSNELLKFDTSNIQNKNYKNAEEYVSGKIESGTAEKSNDVFINNLDTDKKTTVTEIADNLVNTHITTAVTNDAGTVISKNGNLNLKDTSIIGYFEKNGTLLNVDGDLTLEGNSVINAIAGNEYTGYTGEKLDDVVAVKLANNGNLEIKDNSMVLGAVEGNGTIVYENIDNETYFNKQDVDSILINTTSGETTEIALGNITLKDSGTGVQNAGKLVIDNQSSEKLKDKEVSTSITLANNINIEKGIDGSKSTNGIELILGDGQKSSDNSIKVGGEILLGQADDTIIINNILGKYDENQEAVIIDGGAGDKDTVILKNLNGNHDTFDYKLKNIETLDLSGETWKIGENASIEFGNSGTTTKANNDKITIQNGTLMGELTGDKDTGASFENNVAVENVLGNSDFGDNVKFQMGIGAGMKLEAGAEYNIDDNLKNNLATNVGKDKITASGIFTHAKDDTDKELRVKTAQEMGIVGRYSELYNKMLANADREDVRNVLNNGSFEEIAEIINSKGAMGDTLATTGYKITRDISNSFISSVNEWNKKANKGEWLANAKYINSDMEYDGANKVKGYDSDITSMVGMVEYGVSDSTSYGVALGGGDTEVDVTGAGTLKGDNYYIGAYAKHSTNGFDLVGNLGYTISDLEVDGEGSADSSAITFAGYVKRDIRLTETVKLEPNLAFTYDYIMQDDAEGNGVKVENKDIHVFEATAGMNIVKEFAFNNGNLELKAGVKYSMADINRNEETTISTFGMEPEVLGNPEVDDTKGTAHIGFDYEHTTGFGVNGKYETMWSDSGDDSRITAGVSYRF